MNSKQYIARSTEIAARRLGDDLAQDLLLGEAPRADGELGGVPRYRGDERRGARRDGRKDPDHA